MTRRVRTATGWDASPSTAPPLPEANQRSALTVCLLTTLVGRRQNLMARKIGVSERRMTHYRSGKVIPRPRVLGRMAKAAGVSVPWIEAVVADVFLFRRLAGVAVDAAMAGDLASLVGRRLEGRLAPRAEALRAALRRPDVEVPVPEEGDRAAAVSLWALLEAVSPEEREARVIDDESFHHWALAERVAAQSTRTAARDPAAALQLAQLALLALRIAELIPGGAGWRSRNRGYALGHVGNARRVGNQLPAAERDFVRARRLFEAGAADDPGLLDASRLFDLEASLRRAQRNVPLTLALLDKARTAARTQDAVGRVLVNRGVALEQFGRTAEAVPVLREAIPLLDENEEPRVLCVAYFNLAVDLLDLGRLTEAQALLPDVRARAERIGYRRDLLRVRWLEARFEIARGRRAEGVAALDRVRAEFVADRMPYDAALAALVLATLHLDRRDAISAAKARELAKDVFPVFEAQGRPP
ncbi:MAG TPA: helix-turn-helix transcriptional regulator [Thermoanaerobaculia bacterium]|jgi:tetratricopeptide (TPR) repeat protein|nr:helix-turn-helix transcriptional regulator [Thermoanaerobaculia bacterium]